jgi:hypothetical protein
MMQPLEEAARHEICAFGLIPKKRLPADEPDMQNTDHSRL